MSQAIPVSKAAAECKLSVIKYLALGIQQGLDYGKLYPAVNPDDHRLLVLITNPRTESSPAPAATTAASILDGWPKNTWRLLDKFMRKKFWGGHKVSYDSIKKFLAPGIGNWEEILDQLLKNGILTKAEKSAGNDMIVSLDPNRKNEIENIVEAGAKAA